MRGKRTSDKAQAHGSYSYRVSDPYDRLTLRRDGGVSARPLPGAQRWISRSVTLGPLPTSFPVPSSGKCRCACCDGPSRRSTQCADGTFPGHQAVVRAHQSRHYVRPGAAGTYTL